MTTKVRHTGLSPGYDPDSKEAFKTNPKYGPDGKSAWVWDHEQDNLFWRSHEAIKRVEDALVKTAQGLIDDEEREQQRIKAETPDDAAALAESAKKIERGHEYIRRRGRMPIEG